MKGKYESFLNGVNIIERGLHLRIIQNYGQKLRGKNDANATTATPPPAVATAAASSC